MVYEWPPWSSILANVSIVTMVYYSIMSSNNKLDYTYTLLCKNHEYNLLLDVIEDASMMTVIRLRDDVTCQISTIRIYFIHIVIVVPQT